MGVRRRSCRPHGGGRTIGRRRARCRARCRPRSVAFKPRLLGIRYGIQRKMRCMKPLSDALHRDSFESSSGTNTAFQGVRRRPSKPPETRHHGVFLVARRGSGERGEANFRSNIFAPLRTSVPFSSFALRFMHAGLEKNWEPWQRQRMLTASIALGVLLASRDLSYTSFHAMARTFSNSDSRATPSIGCRRCINAISSSSTSIVRS